MAATALEVRVRQGRHRVELNRFTESLENIVTALRDIDKLAASESKRSTWVVDDISRIDDFLTVRITVRLDQDQRRTEESLLLPIEALVDGAQLLTNSSAMPPYYSELTVERLLKASERKRGVDDVSLATVNGKVGSFIDLSGDFRVNAVESVREFESAVGSVTGHLNLIARQSSGKRIRLSVFDATTRRAVAGDAAAGMSDSLRNLWGHRVLLDGRVTRNRHGQPVRISVRDIEALPDDNLDRTDVDELLGIAPDWTGGIPVDEYVRSLRRG